MKGLLFLLLAIGVRAVHVGDSNEGLSQVDTKEKKKNSWEHSEIEEPDEKTEEEVSGAGAGADAGPVCDEFNVLWHANKEKIVAAIKAVAYKLVPDTKGTEWWSDPPVPEMDCLNRREFSKAISDMLANGNVGNRYALDSLPAAKAVPGHVYVYGDAHDFDNKFGPVHPDKALATLFHETVHALGQSRPGNALETGTQFGSSCDHGCGDGDEAMTDLIAYLAWVEVFGAERPYPTGYMQQSQLHFGPLFTEGAWDKYSPTLLTIFSMANLDNEKADRQRFLNMAKTQLWGWDSEMDFVGITNVQFSNLKEALGKTDCAPEVHGARPKFSLDLSVIATLPLCKDLGMLFNLDEKAIPGDAAEFILQKWKNALDGEADSGDEREGLVWGPLQVKGEGKGKGKANPLLGLPPPGGKGKGKGKGKGARGK